MSTIVDLGTLDPRLRGLQRPAEARLTSGLCRALAARYRVDPLLVRVAAIGLVLVGGLGLVLYAWGTLLTPRAGGEPPIRRLLPAFEQWSIATQIMVVALSVIAVVGLQAIRGSVPWGPLVVIGVVALWASRRRGADTVHSPQPWSGATPESPEAAVQAWRSRMAVHGAPVQAPDAHLPEVDLYGPEPERRPLPPDVHTAAARAPRSWWGGAVVVGLGVAAAGTSVALGLTPDLLWAVALASLTMGAAALLWALVVRSRRLPGLVLAVILALGAATAGLGSWAAEAPTTPAGVPAAGDTVTYWAVADEGAVVDLRHIPLDRRVEVVVVAKFAEVTVLLPGLPLAFEQTTTMAEVGQMRGDGPESQLSLTVNAAWSHVMLKVEP